MESVFQSTPVPCPAPFNLAAYVLSPTDETPGKTALAVLSLQGARRWRYEELQSAVGGVAAHLRSQGIGPGDRVLMRIGNEIAFPLTYLASIWIGAVPVPASAALTVPEITRIAAETEPRAIVAAPGVSLPEDFTVPLIDAHGLAAHFGDPAPDPQMGDPERPAYIIYTSGTSGGPRGVVHAHRAIWARRMMWDGWYGLSESDRLLHAGAFNWTYTLGTGLMDPWAHGATALIPEAGLDPAQLPLLLKRHDATIFAAAPGVYRQMLKHHERLALPKLRHGLSAGEKLPARIRAAWETATGTAVHEALGMSECSTFISGSPARPAPEGASGYPQDGRHLAVLDPEGRPVERGMPGVLAVHRDDPGLMREYLSGDLPLVNDWFLTGDTVSMAEDGAITYLGRADDMMNAGGIRVSPLEVEAVLLTHPGITEAACAEVEVKADTKVIAAFYSGPEALPEEELSAHCAERLASYKCPRIFEYRADLPRSGNGKLNRKALRR